MVGYAVVAEVEARFAVVSPVILHSAEITEVAAAVLGAKTAVPRAAAVGVKSEMPLADLSGVGRREREEED